MNFVTKLRVPPAFVLGALLPILAYFAFKGPTVAGGGKPVALSSAVVEVLRTKTSFYERGRIDAPTSVVEVSDYQCPACSLVSQMTSLVLDSLIEAGIVRYTLIDAALPNHKGAAAGAAFAQCVWEADPALFPEIRTTLLSKQGEWASQDVSESLASITSLFRSHPIGAGPDIGECANARLEITSSNLQEAFKILELNGLSFVPILSVDGKVVQALSPPEYRKMFLQSLGVDGLAN